MTRVFGYELNEETSVIRVIVLKEDVSWYCTALRTIRKRQPWCFGRAYFESIQIKGEFDRAAADSTAEEFPNG